ncbi:YncE family protein, partial [Priestia megaterium]
MAKKAKKINVNFSDSGASNDQLYVIDENNNVISVVNATTNNVVSTIPVGHQPVSLNGNPNNNRIYVTNGGSQTVSVIDGATNTVIAIIPVGVQPAGVGINPYINRI